jgi:WD40 repeat protein
MIRLGVLLVLVASVGLVPVTGSASADHAIKADKDDEAEKEKRLAEIQKEIKELQERIGKLAAEAARLQPAPEIPVKGITADKASAAGLQGAVRALRFSPDGRTLLCSNWSPRILGAFDQRHFSLWDVKTMAPVRPVMKRMMTSLFEFAVKGERVVFAGLGEYEIQNTRTGEAIYSLEPPKDLKNWNPDPAPLWVSPDDETILHQHFDRPKPNMKCTRLQTIRVRTGKVERELKLDGGFPVVAPDGRTVFTFPVEEFESRGDSKVRKEYRPINSATAWNVADGKKRFTIEDKERKKLKGPQGLDRSKDTAPPRIIAFSPDGRRFLWFHDGPHFHVGDLASGATLHALPRVPFAGRFGLDTHESMAFSRDGRMIALDGTGPSLWEVATGKDRHWFPKDASCVLFSNDGSLLAAGGNATVDLWDVWGNRTAPVTGPLSDAALDRTWKLLADEDAAKAFAAMRRLVQHADQSARLIQERVQAYLKNARSGQIPALIRDLDSKEFRVRQSAEQKLRQLGAAARPALRRALKSAPTLECRRRAERILQSSGAPPTGARLQALRAIEVLEASPGGAAIVALKALASQDALHPLALEAKASLERRSVWAPNPRHTGRKR